MLRVWLRQLDQIGMNDPDNNEGHPEDICTVCERRVVDHPGHEMYGIGDTSALWPHRRAAVFGILRSQL